MADNPSKPKEQRDREAKREVTESIIHDPEMAAIVQKAGMISQLNRKENKVAKENMEAQNKKEKEGGSSGS